MSDIRLLADENFNNDLLRALLRHSSKLDIIRVQDTPIVGADDPTLLAWAAAEGRILLTHDIRTIPRYAYERVQSGLPMAGVIEVDNRAAIGPALEDILIALATIGREEWEGQIIFIPL